MLGNVCSFGQFDQDHDPYGEHNFGSFEHAGVTYFFKIDYHALDMNSGSEHPEDPERTIRVLTIMRDDDY